MKTDHLPEDQRRRVHADFLVNEQSYWQIRDSLMHNYRGQWVAVQHGKVIAANSDLLGLMDAAAAAGGHPYIALVGSEDTVFRVRKVVFVYDQTYRPFPLPRVTATFWNDAGTHSQMHADVIPDTGADADPWSRRTESAACPVRWSRRTGDRRPLERERS